MKIFFAIVLLFPFANRAQKIINLYPGAIPNSKESDIKETGGDQPSGIISSVIKPTLGIYLPEKEKSTGAAVVICPVPGIMVLKPDFPENKEDWPFLWGENEVTIGGSADYIFLSNAANDLVNKK